MRLSSNKKFAVAEIMQLLPFSHQERVGLPEAKQNKSEVVEFRFYWKSADCKNGKAIAIHHQCKIQVISPIKREMNVLIEKHILTKQLHGAVSSHSIIY